MSVQKHRNGSVGLADTLKYLADLILSASMLGPSSDNYRQFPLSLAILVCLVAVGVAGLVGSAAVIVAINYIGQL